MPSQSSEYTEETASSDNDTSLPSDFFGNLKTQLTWDGATKQPAVVMRQYVESNRKLELKYKGHLNVSTGDYHFKGHLRKNFYSNVPSIQTVFTAARKKRQGASPQELGMDPDRLLPAGFRALVLDDWSISPGVGYDSSQTNHFRYSLGLRKQPQALWHRSKTDVLLSAKANMDVDAKTNEVTTTAGVRLQLFKYGVTSKQDVKVSLGLDVAGGGRHGKAWVQAPYLKLSENNLAVKLQHNKWTFNYEM